MRKATRSLAMLLVALTLVGLIPFSLFASGETVANETEAEDTLPTNFAETVKNAVGANKMMGGSDFQAGSKMTLNVTAGDYKYTGSLTHKDETTGKLIVEKVTDFVLTNEGQVALDIKDGALAYDAFYNWKSSSTPPETTVWAGR